MDLRMGYKCVDDEPLIEKLIHFATTCWMVHRSLNFVIFTKDFNGLIHTKIMMVWLIHKIAD